MNGTPWKNEADRIYGQWLDADEPPPDADFDHKTLGEEQVRRHIADQQLVDALLQSLAETRHGNPSDRIRRLMDAIAAESPTPASANRTTGILSLIGVAACLMVASTLLLIKFSRESHANEVLTAIRQVSLADTDRIYQVFRTNSVHHHPSELLGKLYLRGTAGFVLQTGEVVCGRHENEYWMVPPEGPVVVASNFDWLDSESTTHALELELLKELSIASRRASLMQLSTIVELVQHDYDVVVRRGTHEDPLRLDELSATRRPADADLPASIRLWFDPDTKIVHSVELAGSVAGRESPRHGLRFVLAPAAPVADDWYRHATHHLGDRPVRRISEEPAASPPRANDNP
jgi:hypothetical protein